MDLEQLQNDVVALSDETAHDDIAALTVRVDAAKRMIREIGALLDQTLMDWIDKNGRIEVGDISYYVGEAKRIKCRDVKATLGMLLAEFAGDLDQVAECLGSSAWKHGAVRNALDDDAKYESLFETEVAIEVKTGKAKREVKSVNSKFIRTGASNAVE